MTLSIERAPFGRTGHESSRVIFGAAALGRMSQEAADPLLTTLLEFGVNHIDTAAGYGDSELRLAPWMAARRRDFFLATKTGRPHRREARASLERSLSRLGVDQVDLIQLHNLVEEDEWEVALGPTVRLPRSLQARDEGLVRFIGVTGHGLRIAGMHQRSLDRFDFDSVLLAVQLRASSRARATAMTSRRCCRRAQSGGVAVQTIKSVARRRWEGQDAAPLQLVRAASRRTGAGAGRTVRAVARRSCS